MMSVVLIKDDLIAVWVNPDCLPRGFDAQLCERDLRPHFPGYQVNVFAGPLPRFPGTYVAHNAEAFDALAFARFGYDDVEWYDTMPACSACGLPAGLDAAARALGGEGKDDAGKKAMLLLSRAKTKDGRVIYPIGTQPLWELMLRYNVVDVLELKRVYEGTMVHDPSFACVHTLVNARGIPIDRAFARCLKALWTKLGNRACDRVMEITGGKLAEDDLYSAAKVKAWLKSEGFEVASLERKQVDAMIADPEGFFSDLDDPIVAKVISVVRERQQSVRATPGKVDRIFVAADADDRVRGCYRHNGAFTGRYTARDLQPHNFPRGVSGLDVGALLSDYRAGQLTLESVEREAAKCGASVGDALGTLMRPVIRAPKGHRLVICDFSRVEACAVAWVSEDAAFLDALFDPTRDVYCEMAEQVYSRPISKADKDERQLGKQIVLGCGYQMGANKFGMTAQLNGVKMQGVTPEQCVQAFRSRFSGVKRAWSGLVEAFKYAVSMDSHCYGAFGRARFERHDNHVLMILPSGRPIVYRNARIEPVVPIWGGAPVMTPTYSDPRGFRKSVYGGLLMDHMCQGLCSDLLKEAMYEHERDGWGDVVMHVHDELVVEVAEEFAIEALRQLLGYMSKPPMWADGFPLACEGFVSDHYVKSPLPGFAHGSGRLGKVKLCE